MILVVSKLQCCSRQPKFTYPHKREHTNNLTPFSKEILICTSSTGYFLALVMVRTFLVTISTLFLFACNDNAAETHSVFTQVPYASLTDSIQKSPGNADLYYRRGVLLYEGDQKDLAETDLRKAWSLQPKEEFALSLNTILADKSPSAPLSFLKEASQKLPESIAVQIALAKATQKGGRADEAIRICNAIIAKFPNQLDALQLKAEILESQNRSTDALQALESAYSYAPFDVELSYNLAFAYAESKNPKALLLADSLMRMDTSESHAEPYYFKALYYSNTGNAKQALPLLDEAIRRDYKFLDAYMEKGQILYAQKSYDAALKTFQLAATITPTFGDAYYWVAKSLEVKGNKEDARLNYQRAYELDKSNKEAKAAMERL